MVANSKLTILRASTIKKNKNFQNQTKQSKTKTEKKKNPQHHRKLLFSSFHTIGLH